MNDHKFRIIICMNNETKIAECIHYLNHVYVPDGFELDFLTLTDAKSITSGYNEGMKNSDAKYKIYMHQDTLVLNKYILVDLLSIFSSNPKIGMVGLTGYSTISPDGMMWHAEDRIGTPYVPSMAASYPSVASYRYDLGADGYKAVSLVDGFFLATAVDIPWNTLDLDGWDFYDAYQSMAMHEKGYSVVVPIQHMPWCLHDDGYVLYLKNYDKYRRKFIKKYSKYLGKDIS